MAGRVELHRLRTGDQSKVVLGLGHGDPIVVERVLKESWLRPKTSCVRGRISPGVRSQIRLIFGAGVCLRHSSNPGRWEVSTISRTEKGPAMKTKALNLLSTASIAEPAIVPRLSQRRQLDWDRHPFFEAGDRVHDEGLPSLAASGATVEVRAGHHLRRSRHGSAARRSTGKPPRTEQARQPRPRILCDSEVETRASANEPR